MAAGGGGEPLDDFERANLREIRRAWREANALPEALVEARTIAGARCEHAWRTQRPRTTGQASFPTCARS
jgi:carboxypeptidase Taq